MSITLARRQSSMIWSIHPAHGLPSSGRLRQWILRSARSCGIAIVVSRLGRQKDKVQNEAARTTAATTTFAEHACMSAAAWAAY